MATSVLLVDDHAVVREGLRRILSDYPEIQVVGEAADGHEALRQVRKLAPEVAVVDLSMPGLDGIEVTRQLAKESPKTRVIILTMHANQDYAARLLQAGAQGFIGKGASGAELAAAILKVANKGTYLPAELLEGLPHRMANAAATRSSGVQGLSDRELQVLKLLAEGKTGREIGAQLHLSIKTVDTYRARLLAKLGLETTADLIRFAIRNGVIENAW
ncbi:MAG TPA: response regulator transcription factor [Candidatus Binataceae bacterium]|nr:response regulator transcription factor [Candidatus Binataceae bacterium]